MSPGPLPPTACAVPASGTSVHVVPFQRMSPEPATKTSVGLLPQTSSRSSPAFDLSLCQAEPFHLTTVPSLPTAKTLVGPLPHRAWRFAVVPDAIDSHAPPPFQ